MEETDNLEKSLSAPTNTYKYTHLCQICPLCESSRVVLFLVSKALSQIPGSIEQRITEDLRSFIWKLWLPNDFKLAKRKRSRCNRWDFFFFFNHLANTFTDFRLKKKN